MSAIELFELYRESERGVGRGGGEAAIQTRRPTYTQTDCGPECERERLRERAMRP